LGAAPTFAGIIGNGFVPHGFRIVAPTMDTSLIAIGREDVMPGGIVADQRPWEWLLLNVTSMCTPIIRPGASNVWLRGGL
jgi:hypothetical protein